MSVRLVLVALSLLLTVGACQSTPSWPPGVQDVPSDAPVRSPEEALDTFFQPPGYDIELVAAEPLVKDPVAIDFDAEGRLWVVEMRGYMPNMEGEGEGDPVGKIVVLDDTSGNGQMDRRTVYMDQLVLPRAIKVLDHGALVAAPPYLWVTHDTTGNLKADTKRVIRDDYGNPDRNPEHNPNGLMWGLDNWIKNARYGGRLQYRDSTWVFDETLQRGQWGLSMDDYGRIYRNYNADPLRVDLVPAHYYERNPALPRTRGVYENASQDDTVWPVRPTPGVNRGYREGVLRDDSTLQTFTAAGSPVAYRGDQLPSALRNDVFVSEPAGNLVRRYEMTEQNDGMLTGTNPYDQAEFLASTDERFRPVNFATAPDGTLYVVDMYRGLIQHKDYLTGYLKAHIEEHELEKPIGLGRIYRITHRSTEPTEPVSLSQKSPTALADVLNHPNGWRRDVAQRLLVERNAQAAVPALRRSVETADSAYTRLHALWTLDGLDAATPSLLRTALSDTSPHVRAAAIRIAEPYLAEDDHSLVPAVRDLLDDEAPTVRRQLAASLGERPLPQRTQALSAVLDRHAEDPIVVSLVVSGLAGHERPFLDHVLAQTRNEGGTSGQVDAIETLAVTLLNTESPSDARALFEWIGTPDRPAWQRLAMLSGVESAAPPPADPQVRRLELSFKPEGLLTATEATNDSVRTRAQSIAPRLGWPGKPKPERPEVPPLTPAQQEMVERGREAYSSTCAQCHGPDGEGIEDVAPSLVDSDLAHGDERRLIRLVLHGLERDQLMPPMKHLSDGEIAEILTYIRRAWPPEATAIDTSLVLEVRGETMARDNPWTEEELGAE